MDMSISLVHTRFMFGSNTTTDYSVEAYLLPELLYYARNMSWVGEGYLADCDSHKIRCTIQTAHEVTVILIR